MTIAVRITERVAAPFTGAKVDREAGTISGVLICGTVSANGRDYPVSVFKRDFGKYEGKPVNCDHGRDATVDRVFGWFKGVKIDADGKPRGTLHCLTKHPMYERVMEAAEKNPALFGFSHVAMCDTRRGPGGREVVEAIREVESIDLVAQPATTKGLFEGRKVPLTIKQLAESIAKHPKSTTKQVLKIKALSEMDGMADVATDMDAGPGESDDVNAAISAGFKTALMAVIDNALSGDMEPKDALAKIKNLLNSHGDAVADATKPDKVDDDGDPATPEGKQKARDGAAILEAIAVCKAVGFTGYSTDDLEAIAAAKPDRRKVIAESYKRLSAGGGAETPISTPRDKGQQTKESKTTTGAAPGRITWDS